MICSQREGGNAFLAYENLRSFVKDHPEIEASPTSLTIPGDMKDGFYEAVGFVQNALAEDALGGSMEDMIGLAARCSKVLDRIVSGSDLTEFNLPRALGLFVREPVAALSKPAFGLVLDALQRNWGFGLLREQADREMVAYRDLLRRCAYEAWAYYGVVASLNPVRFWEVFSPDTVEVLAMPTGVVSVGAQTTSPERRMPEAVFETQDGRYFAMKSELARELDFYGTKIRRRRDMSLGGNSADHTAHRVLLLYRIDGPDNVPLLADRDHLKVLASDLMLEVVLPDEIAEGLSGGMFAERISTMVSKRPVQILVEKEAPEYLEELAAMPDLPPFVVRRLGFEDGVLEEVSALLDEGYSGEKRREL